MIGKRVRVDKQDGSSYFGICKSIDGSTTIVIPEDGSCLEKRAFSWDKVVVVDGPAKKYDIKNIGNTNMSKYTKLVEGMDG